MFNRKAYKKIALKELKGRWTVPVLAALFTIGIISVFEYAYSFFLLSFYSNYVSPSEMIAHGFMNISSVSSTPFPPYIVGISIGFYFILFFISSVFDISYYYLCIAYSHTTEKLKFNTFMKGFSYWLQGFLAFLRVTFFTYLWSLLFIIPGIIKYYSYSMTYFIIIENKNISIRKAMKLSKRITKGHKWDLFVLDLSFIGWDLLSSLTYGIAHLWLTPYKTMTKVNAFHAIKSQAIISGIVSEDDFTENKNIKVTGEDK